jgi:diguanylate cyclase (GGDEF)-like protein
VSTGETSPIRVQVLQRLPQGLVSLSGAALVSLIALLDWISGPTVSFEVFYALAVMAAAWIGGRRHGVLAAGLASAQSLAAQAARMEPIGVTPAVLWNGVSRFAGLWLIAVLVGSLRGSLLQQRRHAMTDALTGVLNRRAFLNAAERERLRARREQTPITFAYLDLDGFKAMNDRLGHAVGDEILSGFAETVIRSIRGSDIVARIGGDEFAILLPDTDARNAVVVVNRIRAALAQECGDCPERGVTASIGLATYHEPADTVEEMVAEADRLMYRAKRNGKDRVVGAVISGHRHRWGDRTRDDAAAVIAGFDAAAGL